MHALTAHLPRLACAGLIGLMPALVPHTSVAQEAYPNRAIRLIVPFQAGSATDAAARPRFPSGGR